MLFNSYTFIFAFLPLTVLLFHAARSAGRFRFSIAVLVAASLFFYAWWKPAYLLLLVPLILADYLIGKWLLACRASRPRKAKLLLGIGVSVNLGALCYFKYANFVADNLSSVFGFSSGLGAIVLPIGISFFTFQKIAFLVDLYKGKVDRFNLLDYALFVTFFPQLIAGPIVHHSEVMPQFRMKRDSYSGRLALGVTFFAFGLSKKVLLADTAARIASPHFNAVAQGAQLDLLTAWLAVLAYTVQLYFDFSAYSDMAIGIGQFFGINLPINFNSPYKSAGIIEFWRRWHITLSRFLRDYLYIPLGGNRKGESRRYVNLFLTMLLGGIWHGAGWTFVIWGALHGAYLMINHAWITLVKLPRDSFVYRKLSQGVTFLAVVVGWVFFRSANPDTALDMLKSMAGAYGFVSSPGSLQSWLIVAGMLAITWFMPNTQELTAYEGAKGAYAAHKPDTVSSRLRWAPTLPWAVAAGVLFAACVMFFSEVSEFIYFQF